MSEVLQYLSPTGGTTGAGRVDGEVFIGAGGKMAAETRSSSQVASAPSPPTKSTDSPLAPKTGEGGNGFICRTPPTPSSVAGPPRDLEGDVP